MHLRLGLLFVLALAPAVELGGCITDESNTDLVTAGPPEIAQVRLFEDYQDTTGAIENRKVFAFGTQPTATATDEHAVTTAASTNQSLRIIMDQLLRGNRLEQVECRDIVALDANGNPTMFSDVTDDATPDDIAKCAVSDAALAQSCVGDNLTCICQIPAGCDGVAFGAPVGVLDNNGDGAADMTQFMPGAVTIVCGPNGDIQVPVDPSMSYWNPSGDQLVPAKGGFDALGPAIVLVPYGGILPTNVTCGLSFSPSIVDDANLEVCAVPGGRPADCTGRLADCPEFLAGCMPGDVSAVTWGVEPLSITSTVNDGDTGVPLDQPIFLTSNAPLFASSIDNITFVAATGPAPDVTIALSNSTTVQITFNTPMTPLTMYTITVPTTVTDSFSQGLPAPLVITFTTAAM
jgi:Bacterial Ig-like domain